MARFSTVTDTVEDVQVRSRSVRSVPCGFPAFTVTLRNIMGQGVGRPRDAEVDAALLRAGRELIPVQGVKALSVGAVAAHAGTNRPAFYRRFQGVPALFLALLRERFTTALDADFDTGNLPMDLEAIQRDQLELFEDPLIRDSLAGFLDVLGTDAELSPAFVGRFLGLRRAAVGTILERAVARGEIAPEPDMEWICDLITGPFLIRTIMPGLPPADENLVSLTVASALSALGYRAP